MLTVAPGFVAVDALRAGLDMLGKCVPSLAWCVAGLHTEPVDRGLVCSGVGGSMKVLMCPACAPRVREVVAWWIDEVPWARATGLNVSAVTR